MDIRLGLSQRFVTGILFSFYYIPANVYLLKVKQNIEYKIETLEKGVKYVQS